MHSCLQYCAAAIQYEVTKICTSFYFYLVMDEHSADEGCPWPTLVLQ